MSHPLNLLKDFIYFFLLPPPTHAQAKSSLAEIHSHVSYIRLLII